MFSSNDTISPSLQEIYDWKFEQPDPRTVNIIIRFPEDFNPKALKFQKNEDFSTFKATIEGYSVPVISGELTEPVLDYETIINSEECTLTLSFKKETDTTWKYLIKNFIPGTKEIDPHSAFVIMQTEHQEDENKHGFDDDTLEEFLQIGMQHGYLPALLFGIDNLADEPESVNEYLVLLDVACRIYRSPVAAFKLGVYLLSHGDPNNGFVHLAYAARAGIGMAYSLMGQCISPYSGVDFLEKNAKQALILLEKVIEQQDEPIALYEAAQIYNKGADGVPRDKVKARDYWERAHALNNKLPPLKEKRKNVLIGASIAASLAFIGYSTYRIFKRK
jgi:hypothetical protein